ncbi:hypothetical protein NBRC116594_07030 [Shimia sp. NS0008-38b]
MFDSSGPEGKVRGTPQQVIDKYNQLARDSQLGNDRVATENFQQHAEHYQRMLNEAQREQDARREEQERQNRERQAERDRERRERVERQEREANGANDGETAKPAVEEVMPLDLSEAEQPDLIVDTADSGLVETPETEAEAPKPAPAPKKAPRKRTYRKKTPAKDAASDDGKADTKADEAPAPDSKAAE